MSELCKMAGICIQACRLTFRGKKTSGKILNLINENNGITILELSNKMGVTARTIERNLKKLQEQKKLSRVGVAKGGHWELIVRE